MLLPAGTSLRTTNPRSIVWPHNPTECALPEPNDIPVTVGVDGKRRAATKQQRKLAPDRHGLVMLPFYTFSQRRRPQPRSSRRPRPPSREATPISCTPLSGGFIQHWHA